VQTRLDALIRLWVGQPDRRHGTINRNSELQPQTADPSKGEIWWGGRNYNAATVDDIISRRDNEKRERTDPKMMSGMSHAILQMFDPRKNQESGVLVGHPS
jgi:hypothetical protein